MRLDTRPLQGREGTAEGNKSGTRSLCNKSISHMECRKYIWANNDGGYLPLEQHMCTVQRNVPSRTDAWRARYFSSRSGSEGQRSMKIHRQDQGTSELFSLDLTIIGVLSSLFFCDSPSFVQGICSIRLASLSLLAPSLRPPTTQPSLLCRYRLQETIHMYRSEVSLFITRVVSPGIVLMNSHAVFDDAM